MKKWIYLMVAVALEVAGTLSMKALDGFTAPGWIIVVVVGYAGAFYCLSQLLTLGMPVGVAYGVWAALGVALTATLGTLIFGEPLTWVIGVGIVLVISGVLVVEIGSQQAAATVIHKGHS
ncbi:MAG: DMT family transporter [Pseudonocardiaceae bacterium]